MRQYAAVPFKHSAHIISAEFMKGCQLKIRRYFMKHRYYYAVTLLFSLILVSSNVSARGGGGGATGVSKGSSYGSGSAMHQSYNFV